MSKRLELQLNHSLSNDVELVYQTLLDFRKFGKIHPYIKEVEIIDDHSPEYIEYNIREEIYLLGFIKNHPVYNAKVYEIEKNQRLRYVSQVKKNIALEIEMTFKKGEKNTLIVEERIYVTANVFLGKIFMGILKKAHLQFFDKLRKILRNSVEDIS